ncbi:hypothetical protein EDB19DRAFT_765914 [Suillus lakei]|nr:hypothetical protein EDB19DRAFT_765914 [Suillus lakei]
MRMLIHVMGWSSWRGALGRNQMSFVEYRGLRTLSNPTVSESAGDRKTPPSVTSNNMTSNLFRLVSGLWPRETPIGLANMASERQAREMIEGDEKAVVRNTNIRLEAWRIGRRNCSSESGK